MSLLVFILSLRMSTASTISLSTSCPWRANLENFASVKQPQLHFFDIQTKCPKDEYGALFTEICAKCVEKSTNIDEGQFTICFGCVEKSAAATLVATDVCNYIKNQEIDVALQDAAADEEIQAYAGEAVTAPPWTNTSATEGTLTAECTIDPDSTPVQPDPAARVNFDCGPCVAKGVPKLAAKCCEACELFANDKEMWRSLVPFVACMGCDKEELESGGEKYPATHDAPYFATQFSRNAAERRLANHMCAPVKKVFDAKDLAYNDDRRLATPTYDPADETACEAMGGSDLSRSCTSVSPAFVILMFAIVHLQW